MPIHLTVDVATGVAVLGLELGRGNAIDNAFVAALNTALDDVEQTDARAVVLTGKGRVFCGGLDLVALDALDRTATESFFDSFDRLFRRVFAFERPVVAAINGHALAGGCILAMACDLRVMADGPYFIGVNEVHLGIPFPGASFEIAWNATPPAARSRVLLQGRRFSPAEAHDIRLVQRLAGERGAVAEAVEEAQLFASAGPTAVRAMKADSVAPVLARIDATLAERRARFVEAWFGPEAQGRLAALRADLAAKQKPAP